MKRVSHHSYATQQLHLFVKQLRRTILQHNLTTISTCRPPGRNDFNCILLLHKCCFYHVPLHSDAKAQKQTVSPWRIDTDKCQPRKQSDTVQRRPHGHLKYRHNSILACNTDWQPYHSLRHRLIILSQPATQTDDPITACDTDWRSYHSLRHRLTTLSQPATQTDNPIKAWDTDWVTHKTSTFVLFRFHTITHNFFFFLSHFKH